MKKSKKVEALIGSADEAMNCAKNRGKGTVVLADNTVSVDWLSLFNITDARVVGIVPIMSNFHALERDFSTSDSI